MALIDRKPSNTFNFLRLHRAYNATLADLPICDVLPIRFVLLPPSDVQASVFSDTENQITWTDNSNDETGFEIWRADTENGEYALIGTVAANTEEFIDDNI